MASADARASGNTAMTKPHDAADDVRIVEVYSAANDVEAGAIRAALDAEGIRARIVGDRLGNVWGEVPLGFRSEPKIWVREEDAAAARRVIEQLQDQMGDEYDDPNAKTDPFDADEADGDGGE